ERQSLVLRAMFTLLNEGIPVTEQELLRRVRKLAPPGGVYARAQKLAQPCSKCGSNMGQRRNRCLFCGEERETMSAFEFLEMDTGAQDNEPDAPPSGAGKKQSSEHIRAARRRGH